MIFYRIAWVIVRTYLFIFTRIKVEGRENIPQSGPVVFVGNHPSLWDPVYMAITTKRVVHYMAKEELFHKAGLKQLVTALGAFPVKRGKIDRNSLRTAAKYLENGEVLGIFPEGTRSKNNQMRPFLPGAALFALRSGAPIVPFALKGTEKIFGGRIKIKIGKPLVYPEYYKGKIGEEILDRVTQDCRDVIRQMLCEA